MWAANHGCGNHRWVNKGHVFQVDRTNPLTSRFDDVFGPIDNLHCPFRVDRRHISGAEPAIGIMRFFHPFKPVIVAADIGATHFQFALGVAVPRQRSRPRPDRIALVALAAAAAIGLAVFSAGEVAAQEWQLQRVDGGTKPALSVAPDGTPSIIYMLERQDGWVRISQLQDGEWQSEQVADGYFYGPPDIAVGPDGVIIE